MERFQFNEADLEQMRALGITEPQVAEQLEIFRKSSALIRLKRPCTPGDGVRRIEFAEPERYLELHQKAAQQGRFIKLVPASGAATRMFQSILEIFHLPENLEMKEFPRNAKDLSPPACDLCRFIDSIQRFPFSHSLETVLAKDGFDLNGLVESHHYRTILKYLLASPGLDYGSLPKGLLPFHSYPTGCRTPFEEHLAEAVCYVASADRVCRIHFTVSSEHEANFTRLYEQVKPTYENNFEVTYQVSFSHQQPSTNTIAVDLHNRPFRDRLGRLVFRPGGHGALIENLYSLQGDLVYIKNIDNVIQDRFRDIVGYWKRVLGGYLVALEGATHEHVRELKTGISGNAVGRAEAFAKAKLLLPFPEGYAAWPLEDKHAFLLKKLNRPIRVCGVVRNEGEPGGAPFWVEDRSGEISLQIVEKAQVDLGSPEQREIWNSATHFNPVDLVCSVRDHEGKAFVLKDYVDQDAVFISEKSMDGRSLKALELPGLWNGAMSGWLTVMVEVPLITFNPVKSVFDLLKPEHQPE